MSEQPTQYRPGDVVNGHMLSSDGRWLPLGATPGGPSYAPPGYAMQAIYLQGDPASHSALAPVTSLVSGLLALCVCWIPILGLVAWLLAPIGLIFGIIGMQRGKAEHKIMSGIGIASSGIALVVCVLWVIAFA